MDVADMRIFGGVPVPVPPRCSRTKDSIGMAMLRNSAAIVDCGFVGEMPFPVSHSWSVAQEGVGMAMPTYRDVGSAGGCLEQRRPIYRSYVVNACKYDGRVAP